MPAHNHSLNASNAQGDTFAPGGALSATVVDSSQQPLNGYIATPNTTMAPQAIGAARAATSRTTTCSRFCA